MGARHMTAEERDRIFELRAQGLSYPKISAATGFSYSTIITTINNYVRPDRQPNPDDDIEYWPRIAPPPPTVPAAVALDYRLSPRERALRQHGRVK